MSTATLDRPPAIPKVRRPKTAPADLLAHMDTEELHRQLDRCLAFSAEGLRKAAEIVVELRRREVRDRVRDKSLARLPADLRKNLELIGSGDLLPELVITFAGSATLIQHARTLPLDEQRRLIDGAKVPLAVPKGDKIVTELRRPVDLKANEVRQVFAPDRIRPVKEQAELRKAAPPPQAARPAGSWLNVYMTTDERAVLDAHAARAGKGAAEMARIFLEKAGAFKRPKT